MPFNFQELTQKIEKFRDAKDGAWVVVIGCAPASAECPDSTQFTKPYALENQLDHEDTPDRRRGINLAFLIEELDKKLKELKQKEQALSPAEREER